MPRTDSSLLDEFRQLGAIEQKRPCKVAEALDQVDPKKRPLVEQALMSDDEQVRRGVKVWFRKQNLTAPSVASLTHHRNGSCRCGS